MKDENPALELEPAVSASSETLVRDLIDSVRKEEIIYKPGHKYFRHLIKKHQAYLTVAQELTQLGHKDITAERVKQKWNTVKTMYYRHKPNCGNPCSSKSRDPGFHFCTEMDFLDDTEFKFYRNRKTNHTASKNGALATASVNETQDGMDRLYEILNSAEAQSADGGNELLMGQIHEDSVISAEETRNGNDRKRSADPIDFDYDMQTKRSLLLDLQVEHQRILNRKAEQEARLAKYEADFAELRLNREMNKDPRDAL